MITVIILIMIAGGSCVLIESCITSKNPTPKAQCSSVCDAREKSVLKKTNDYIICKCKYVNKIVYFKIEGNNITKIEVEENDVH